MENPNTRPYTAEELEALFIEEASNSDMPQNNKGGNRGPDLFILQDNNVTATEITVVEKLNLDIEPMAEKPNVKSKLQSYAPFIILGVILTGVGIYLYYDYQKRKETEKTQKPKKE